MPKITAKARQKSKKETLNYAEELKKISSEYANAHRNLQNLKNEREEKAKKTFKKIDEDINAKEQELKNKLSKIIDNLEKGYAEGQIEQGTENIVLPDVIIKRGLEPSAAIKQIDFLGLIDKLQEQNNTEFLQSKMSVTTLKSVLDFREIEKSIATKDGVRETFAEHGVEFKDKKPTVEVKKVAKEKTEN